MYSFGLFVVLALVYSSVNGANARKYVDLTYAFNNETVLYPGRKSTFNIEFEGFTPGGYWIASKGFCTSEHTSTHIDAPYHFHQNGRTLDQIPLEDLIDVRGVLIDIYSKVHHYTDGKLTLVENYALTREDIIEWEKVNGQIPPRSVVLLRSGWGSRWPNINEYRGVKQVDPKSTSTADVPESGSPEGESNKIDFSAQSNLNFPGFAASAAKLLVSERNVLGVGTDTLSIDIGRDSNFPAHQIFAARSVYMIENVGNLHLLPATGFKLWMLPFKIDKGTGAPIRIIAGLETKEDREL